MDVEYTFPGTIEITLNLNDLNSLQDRGFTMDRQGFAGPESKTWVHMNNFDDDTVASYPMKTSADIELGGDLHVRLNRGFLVPVAIERDHIHAREGLVEHYLGRHGVILVNVR